MPKELVIDDGRTFTLKFKDGDAVKQSPEPLDIWRCWNAICETRDRVGHDKPYTEQIDAVCTLVESWGAGRPSHGAAIELSDHLYAMMEELKKKEPPEPDPST